ncbi:hypothetical protein [Haloactinopolyspora alba]|uniref:hypothetical protein n=1 Tax=Haloactinopolyspora alba TaxID=648780 RepID=UPI0011B26558|nr:hypothetical protein [Haloactinopolyspora alba]
MPQSELDDAIAQLTATAYQGHSYADHLARSGPATGTADADGGGSVHPTGRSATDAPRDGHGQPEPPRLIRSQRSQRADRDWNATDQAYERQLQRRNKRRGRFRKRRWDSLEERLLKHVSVAAGTAAATLGASPSPWTFGAAGVAHTVIERLEWKSRRREEE